MADFSNYFAYDALNPIRTVNGAYIKTPSSLQYILSDTSAADAGRTQDDIMHKKRIDQLVKLELSWNALTTTDCAALINIFNPQYLNVQYFDLLANGWRTVSFYVGDRTAPMYNNRLGIWQNLSFNIIERGGNRRNN